MGNDMVQPADNARGVDRLPVAPCISRDDQHSFATKVAMVTCTDGDVFCNKDHVAKGILQQRPCCKGVHKLSVVVGFTTSVLQRIFLQQRRCCKELQQRLCAKGLAQHAHCGKIMRL